MLSNDDTPKNNRVINPLRTHANKLADKKHKNNVSNIMINNEDTHIPVNLPTAIIGEKGSGKSTMIKAIIDTTNKKVFNHIYFIYSSLTSDLVLPPDVIRVDVNDAEQFLSMLFETKSIFNSYISFFRSLDFNKLQQLYERHELQEADIMKYVDNNVIKYNKQVVNSVQSPYEKIDAVINTGTKIVKHFSNPFNIGNVRIEGLRYDERDAVIIDDIAIAAKILFKQIKDNPLYEYLTLTRHMRIFVLFAGQQVEQIPKSLRREIMCWLFAKNTNLELLNGVIQKTTIQKIEQKQEQIGRYEFVIYNAVDGIIDVI